MNYGMHQQHCTVHLTASWAPTTSTQRQRTVSEHDFLVLRLLLDVRREVLQKLWRLALAYNLDYGCWNPPSRIHCNNHTQLDYWNLHANSQVKASQHQARQHQIIAMSIMHAIRIWIVPTVYQDLFFPFLWIDHGCRGWCDSPQTALRLILLRHGLMCDPGVWEVSACSVVLHCWGTGMYCVLRDLVSIFTVPSLACFVLQA